MIPSHPPSSAIALTPEQFLENLQGQRRLTRRVIDAYPADQLFTFSIGGMRSFGEMAMELIETATPIVRGVVTGEWERFSDRSERPKDEIIRLWDESTEQINDLWPQIPPERFQEHITAFGQWPGPVNDLLFYAIYNEIHHRGQGYVYLRALGVEPPVFYDLS